MTCTGLGYLHYYITFCVIYKEHVVVTLEWTCNTRFSYYKDILCVI